MKSSKRAMRRHHTSRVKNNRRYHWGRSLDKKELGIVVNTPTPCSCYMCGNPRKFLGEKSLAEKKNQLRFEQMEQMEQEMFY